MIQMRKRSTPWIQQKSRLIIAGIGAFGAAITSYLTIQALQEGPTSCPTEGCESVLDSPYAEVFGLPLALFGFLAYVYMIAMAVIPLLISSETQTTWRKKAENYTWILMFIGGCSMAIFSSYLMYIMAFEIQSICWFCIGSAIASFSLLALTIIGRNWEDIGQLVFLGVIVAMVTIISTLAIYAPINNPSLTDGSQNSYNITSVSNPDNISLAQHLTNVGAAMYGAYWCNFCQQQKQLFGRQAINYLTYIECDPAGENPQPDLCQAKGIPGYPAWEINGELHPWLISLERLAELSGYTGSRNFGNS
ncbi:Vitamin K epoxide reductase [Limnospira maxima CS-328]|uniref:Vitamin K epoxide reductase n=1 Tax=Limnospira maxima CS-328 TaxID=513049 RepID=B5W3P0_LIMMA|nr:vitamin K epoxide reductase family protein [Limnospira maxima]EDZ93876.1 Vitamin K epoxide reductase [Limnospira maxima CS-328]MDC0837186.1 vitamin K epoxide reductase family protein [Limnoraphis robusta]